MDNDTTKYISVLTDIIKAMTIGLESAILLMDKWDEMTPEQREAVIKNLTVIVAKGKSTYEMDSL